MGHIQDQCMIRTFLMKIHNVLALHKALRAYTEKLRAVIRLDSFPLIYNPSDVNIYIFVSHKNVSVYFTVAYNTTYGKSYLDMYSPGSVFYRDNIFWSLLYTIDTYKFVYGLYKE